MLNEHFLCVNTWYFEIWSFMIVKMLFVVLRMMIPRGIVSDNQNFRKIYATIFRVLCLWFSYLWGPAYEVDMFLSNLGNYLQYYMMLPPTIPHSTFKIFSVRNGNCSLTGYNFPNLWFPSFSLDMLGNLLLLGNRS
jgi:hypothetical protein